jgi:hypothetical protein
MAETLTIRTASSTEVVNIASVGPQGPKGDKGDPGEVAVLPLTTQGDTLYRGAAANERLAIGAAGQILKVVAGEPAWANESGAVVSVNGETGTVVLDAADVGAAPATGIDPTAISGTAVVDSDARLSDARTPTSHTHGNLTNDGKLGSTSGLPVVTTTAGAVTTLALGTANQVFRVNSGATGVEFGAGFDAASPPAIGNTTPNTGAFTTLTASGETELVNGTSAAGPFRIYNTFTDASNYERLSLRWASNVAIIGTEKAGTGSARALEFQTDGVTRMTIASSGGTINVGSGAQLGSTGIQVASTASLRFSGGAIGSSSDLWMLRSGSGIIRFATGTSTSTAGFNRLQFGGTTSSFPALKRDTTTLQVKLADDSAFTSIQGKLTTETAYTAGAPTATGYLLLYDSNGTAYKVPAEAL